MDVIGRRAPGRLHEDAHPEEHLFAEDTDGLFHAVWELTRTERRRPSVSVKRTRPRSGRGRKADAEVRGGAPSWERCGKVLSGAVKRLCSALLSRRGRERPLPWATVRPVAKE